MAAVPCVVSIEDDFDVFKLIQLTLRSLNINLYHAPSGSRALEMARDLKPDLVLLDLALPDIYGWELLNKIRELKDTPLKHVVVLTARAEVSPYRVASERNVDAYVNKPFVPADLREKVRDLLEAPVA